MYYQNRNSYPPYPPYQQPYGQPVYPPPYSPQPVQQVRYVAVPPPYALQNQAEKRELSKTVCGLAWMTLIAVLCLTLLSSLNSLVINSLPIYGGDANTTYQVISAYTTGFFYLLAIFLPPLIYLKIRGLAVADFIPTQRVSAGLAILMVGLGVGVSLLSNQASSWVSTLEAAFGFEEYAAQSALGNTLFSQISYVLIWALVPALSEEFLFRGVILGSLRKFGGGFAVVSSAALFALYHGNFSQGAFTFCGGLIMGFLVLRTGNIWISVLVHFLNNAIACTYEVLFYKYDSVLFGQLGFSISELFFYVTEAVFVALAIAAVIYLFCRKRGYLTTAPHRAGQLSASQKTGALFGNAGMIVYLIFSLITCFSMLQPIYG